MIRIDNLYMMLAYVWNRFEQTEVVKIAAISQPDLPNLMASVLCGTVKHILKRGLFRAYVGSKMHATSPRGRIDVSDSIKSGGFLKMRVSCDVDEFSNDVLCNQIILTTLNNLSRSPALADALKVECRSLARQFPSVQDVRLSRTVFNNSTSHRSPAYALALQICEMLFGGQVPTERAGVYRFRDFEKIEGDKWRLFQDFICNFYRKEAVGFHVSAKHIHWDAVGCEEGTNYLPQMRTDVTLRSAERHVIIDTKFSPNVLQSHYGKKSFQSRDLYQISTYLDHQEAANERRLLPKPEGILLYPLATEQVDSHLIFRGRKVRVVTVDLQQPWHHIHDRLCSLVNE